MPLRFLRPVALLTVAALIALPRPAAAQEGDAGAYLAARIAGMNGDFREASQWYARALIADPSNVRLMEGAVIAGLSAGNYDSAVAVARRLMQTGTASQSADLALMGDQAQRGDFAGLLADLEAGRSIGMLIDGLARAWSELGNGRMSEALAEFGRLADTQGVQAFGLYHKALALASVGDFEGADEILSGRAAGTLRLSRRGVIAHAQILSQLERPEEAIALLESAFPVESDPAVTAIIARLRGGEMLPYTIARNATDGMAEVFFTLAVALNGEAEDGYTLLYARIASWLRPDHVEAILLSAALLEQQEQYDLAVETYALVQPANEGFFAAEIGRARALQAADKADTAIEVLQSLARAHAEMPSVHMALGDAFRRQERWAEAAEAYDAAVARIGEPEQRHWSLFYSRAIVNERQKLWDKAEPDFLKALELEPDQPQVLNYLGYSYIEMGVKLEEALKMIERAVEQQPDSGYIVDSLAWGLFRLGRFAEAVEPMERASVLEPVDPIVTDHLGDVYWAVGRIREAQFQWRRALSFNPEEDEANRIRRKLEIGLDAVLAEEGAKPLADLAAGN
jgi:tetratricopeptide (TPR) repeat protein